MAKTNRITMTAPSGVFVWPKLTAPDYGSKQFPKPDGEYSTKARYDEAAPEFAAFMAKLQPYYDAALVSAQEAFDALKPAARAKLGSVKPHSLYSAVYDDRTEEPTGEVEIKFASLAGGTIKNGPRAGQKWKRDAPAIFDRFGQRVRDAKLEIWSGTVGKVSFSFDPAGYFIPGTGMAGLSLQLEAVQIINLAQGSGGNRNASSYGFGEEDGDFDASTLPTGDDDAGDDDAEFASREAADPAGSREF